MKDRYISKMLRETVKAVELHLKLKCFSGRRDMLRRQMSSVAWGLGTGGLANLVKENEEYMERAPASCKKYYGKFWSRKQAWIRS